MHVSFIIPAYNEEALIGQTLDAISSAVDACRDQLTAHEIIVVNDASTDRTAEIAAGRGARVVNVEKRHIAAVRNAGAKEARGDVFIFVDADTIMPAATLHAALRELRAGAVAGGSEVRLENLPWHGWIYFQSFLIIWRLFRYAAGCFIFARREAFEAVGGFDEQYFAGEEMFLSKALKRHGRWVIVKAPVISSGRKGRQYGLLGMTRIGLRMLARGPKSWKQREGLELWYDGRRETPGS